MHMCTVRNIAAGEHRTRKLMITSLMLCVTATQTACSKNMNCYCINKANSIIILQRILCIFENEYSLFNSI